MVRPCKRRKVRNPSGKVSRRTLKNVVKRTVVHDPTVSRFWDKQKTIQQNFAAVGLTCRVNEDLAKGQIRGGLCAWQEERFEKLVEAGEKYMEVEGKLVNDAKFMRPMLDEEDIFSKLEDLFYQTEDAQENAEAPIATDDIKRTVCEELQLRSQQVAPKEPETLSPFEKEYIEACIKKHSNKYTKMALDHKTNSRQLTARELEKMAEMLNQGFYRSSA